MRIGLFLLLAGLLAFPLFEIGLLGVRGFAGFPGQIVFFFGTGFTRLLGLLARITITGFLFIFGHFGVVLFLLLAGLLPFPLFEIGFFGGRRLDGILRPRIRSMSFSILLTAWLFGFRRLIGGTGFIRGFGGIVGIRIQVFIRFLGARILGG